MQDNNHNHYYGVQSDPKSDAVVGNMMVGGMVAVGILAVALNVYETLTAWYNASIVWILQAGDFIASFWPF